MTEYINSKPKSLISNSTWSLSLMIWQLAVTFFLTPFLIKNLGLEYYGVWVLLFTLSGFMGIMNFGLGEATLRFVAFYYGKHDIDGINRIINNTFAIFLGIGVVSFLLLYFNAQNVVNFIVNDSSNELLFTELIELTAYIIAIGFIGSAFSSIPQALQRYDITTKINIINSILYVLGTVTILLNGGSIKELIIWNLITSVLLQIINIYTAKQLIKNLKFLPKINIDTLKEVFGFSFFTFLLHIFAMVHSNADKILTSSMINATALSYLSVPQQLSTKGAQIITSVGSVLVPKFSSITESSERRELFLDSTWILLVLSALIFTPLTLLMPDFLTLWINEEFSNKTSALGQIIASSFIVSGSFPVYASLFKGIGKAQYMTVIFFVIGTTSLFINYILISNYGFLGLGYAYWVTPLVGILAIFYAWINVLKEKNIMPIVKTYIIPSIMIIINLFIINYFLKLLIINNWFMLILIATCIVVIQSIMLLTLELFLFGMSKRINMLLQVFKSLLDRVRKILKMRIDL